MNGYKQKWKKVKQMSAIDVFIWIVIGFACAFVFGFFVWALCVIASQSDEISEEYWKQYQAEHGDEEDSL